MLRLYGAFLDYAVITGEIQQNLFSASAHRASQQVRIQHVKSFASRITEIQSVVRHASVRIMIPRGVFPELLLTIYPKDNRDDPTWDDMYSFVVVVLELMLHSLLTIVHRILPPSSTQAHPLQCSDECVVSARMALSTLTKVGNDMLQISSTGWSMMLSV